jgi:hypothetical protein
MLFRPTVAPNGQTGIDLNFLQKEASMFDWRIDAEFSRKTPRRLTYS